MSEVELSSKAKKLKTGEYLHYKNLKVKVLGVGFHSENLEEFVIYQEISNHSLWVRPLKMFLETVEIEGKKVPRFKYLGSSKKSK